MPIAFRGLLIQDVVVNVTELSIVFLTVSASALKYEDFDNLEKDTVKNLCKLEIIFPPDFFYSMEHLPLYLSWECKVEDQLIIVGCILLSV